VAKQNINSYFFSFTNHLKKSTPILILVTCLYVLGIILGIVLLFGEKSYLSLLTNKNQTLLGYISGNVSVFKLFFPRLFSCLFSVAIISACCLTVYTSFIGIIYLVYQAAITTIVCGTLIHLQGFSGVLNTLFLILPSNLILLSILAVVFSIGYERSRQAKKYNLAFSNSFQHCNYWSNLIICLIAILALNILFSIILPIIIRGIYLIYY